MTSTAASFVALIVVSMAALSDVSTRRVPNVLTFGAAAAAIVYSATMSGPAALGLSAGGWLVGVGLFLPVFLVGGMGAGDVKLLGAVGAWLGPVGALHVALGSALAGGVLAVLVSWRAGYLLTATRNLERAAAHWGHHGPQPVPGLTLADGSGPRLAYAVPILIGTVGAVWLR